MYSMQSRKKSLFSRISIGWWIFSALAIILVIIFHNALFRIFTPISDISTNIIDTVIDSATPKKVLLARQRQLEEQNSALTAQVQGMQLLEDENASLRTILDYPKIVTTSITARIVAKPSQSVYDRVGIDRGSADGVMVGDKIIAGENGYIATIDQVSPRAASGTLVSSSSFKGDAVIARLGITVPVTGKGSGNFELHIPRDLDVRDGDLMTIPGAPDYVFGVIKSIQFDERDPYQTVLARTPVNVQELKFVRVVK
jgi:cell shape-determining protein MreC